MGVIEKIKLLFNKKQSHQKQVELFNAPPEIFEKLVGWRILSDPTYFTLLCNDTWKWFAVEVPYIYRDKKGEIDILMCRPETLTLGSHLIYKGYQLKVSKVGKDDNVLSHKKSDGRRFKQAVGQLKRLRDFGCERVCFLEAIILETSREYSGLPMEIMEEVKKKAKILQKEKVGYVIIPIQYCPGVPEKQGGYFHPPINILSSPLAERKEGFQHLASRVNAFFEKSAISIGTGLPVVNYCRKCKDFGIVFSGEKQLICFNCKSGVL